MTAPRDDIQPHRPNIAGTRHVIGTGHYLATHAGFQVLEGGGNAVDAAVAAGLALCVVESAIVGIGGVAPMIIRPAESRQPVVITGLGGWPRAASAAYFQENFDGAMPEGILRTVVPGALDAYVTALERFGTLSFGEVVIEAIRFAKDGFPVYALMTEVIRMTEDNVRGWPSSAAIFLPGGKIPQPGEIFKQTDLVATLQFLADEEVAHAGDGRLAGLKAVREAFYRGDIAAQIVHFHEENGGLMTIADMASFRVDVEPPVTVQFGKFDVHTCGPWCQGPMLLQALSILAGVDLAAMGHNSPAYLHALAEAIKLAAADREAYYGDPKFVSVPMAALLSPEYAAERRRLIRSDAAWPDMPEPGRPSGADGHDVGGGVGGPPGDGNLFDTSYVCVVDRWGNVVSATPSGTPRDQPVVPGTGFTPSTRGQSSWTDPRHPSSVAPGKRPRMTPNPALAVRRDGTVVMPFGTPGGDVQTQAMLQVFLNVHLFAMDPQSAVEAPRIATASFPSSFQPHGSRPGNLSIESRIPHETGERLAALGHQVEWWPASTWQAGSVGTILWDVASGLKVGAVDHRRTGYALGW